MCIRFFESCFKQALGNIWVISSLNLSPSLRSLLEGAVLFWGLKRDPNLENYPCPSGPSDPYFLHVAAREGMTTMRLQTRRL